MELPDDRKYTKDHEWVKLNSSGSKAKIGITKFAIDQLGDVVHIELPEIGDSFDDSDSFGTIESTKTVSDLYMPLKGEVVAVNNDIEASLESLSEDPYNGGWLIEIKLEDPESDSELLSRDDYDSYIEE